MVDVVALLQRFHLVLICPGFESDCRENKPQINVFRKNVRFHYCRMLVHSEKVKKTIQDINLHLTFRLTLAQGPDNCGHQDEA